MWLGLDGVGLSGSIVRIDPSTMDETLRVRLDARVIDLALGGGALWANGNDGLLRRIDLTTGGVTPTRSPGNGAIDWGSDGLWVTDITGSLVQLTSELERSGSSIDVGPNVVGVNSGEGVVWLTQQRPDGTFAVVAVDNAIDGLCIRFRWCLARAHSMFRLTSCGSLRTAPATKAPMEPLHGSRRAPARSVGHPSLLVMVQRILPGGRCAVGFELQRPHAVAGGRVKGSVSLGRKCSIEIGFLPKLSLWCVDDAVYSVADSNIVMAT